MCVSHIRMNYWNDQAKRSIKQIRNKHAWSQQEQHQQQQQQQFNEEGEKEKQSNKLKTQEGK